MNLINIYWTLLFNIVHFGFSGLLRWKVVFVGRMRGSLWKGNINVSALNGSRVIVGKRYTKGIESSSYTYWNVKGDVLFRGEARIPFGSIIEVTEGANLIMGEGFRGSHGSKIIVHERIELGSNVLLAWNAKILDTDFHRLSSMDGLRPMSKPILIGNKCWIGINAVITKGTRLGNHVFIGPNVSIGGMKIPSYTIIKNKVVEIRHNSHLID